MVETETEWLTIVSAVVDVSFIVDTLIMFRKTILEEESGEEIKELKEVDEFYLKGRFRIDLLISVPFNYVRLLFLKQENPKQL